MFSIKVILIVGILASFDVGIRPGHSIDGVPEQIVVSEAPPEVVLPGLSVEKCKYPESNLVDHSVELLAADNKVILNDVVVHDVLRVVHRAVNRVSLVLHRAYEYGSIIVIGLSDHHLVS